MSGFCKMKNNRKNKIDTECKEKNNCIIKTKICTKCKAIKELTKFTKKASNKNGIRSECKDCQQAYNKKYGQDNRETIKIKKKLYYNKNKEIILKKQSIYYYNHKKERTAYYNGWKKENKHIIVKNKKDYAEKNKDKIKEGQKEYYKNNNDILKLKSKIWKKNNPDKVRHHSRVRRARKKFVDEHFDEICEKFVYSRFNYRCFNCGSENNLTIDHHYCLNDGYALDIDNAVVLCQSCNSSKRSKSPLDFYSKEKLKDLNKILQENNLEWKK